MTREVPARNGSGVRLSRISEQDIVPGRRAREHEKLERAELRMRIALGMAVDARRRLRGVLELVGAISAEVSRNALGSNRPIVRSLRRAFERSGVKAQRAVWQSLGEEEEKRLLELVGNLVSKSVDLVVRSLADRQSVRSLTDNVVRHLLSNPQVHDLIDDIVAYLAQQPAVLGLLQEQKRQSPSPTRSSGPRQARACG